MRQDDRIVLDTVFNIAMHGDRGNPMNLRARLREALALTDDLRAEVAQVPVCLSPAAATGQAARPPSNVQDLTPVAYLDLLAAKAERDRLHALVNSPEVAHFLRGTHLEAVHQVERWGTAHDRAKRPADWFWLVGYLAGKALHAAVAGDVDKARHHCISTAAALYNWHSAISGHDTRMCPGSSDVARIVDAAFPGEAAPEVLTAKGAAR